MKLFTWILVLHGWEVQSLKRAPNALPEMRGGHYNRNQQAVELNPTYMHYNPPPPGGAIDEHEEWLRQQNQVNPQTVPGFQGFESQQWNRRNSMVDDVKQYILAVHSSSPCVAWTAFSCVVIFILWQVPSLQAVFRKNFVCNRSSIKRTVGFSLVLSAVSHASLYHLLGNLVTLLSIAPGVARNVTTPLWPLFLGSAVCSNVLFTGLRRHGSCIGLSGVTMSIIAVQARAAPTKVYQILLAGIFPVRLQSKHILYALLGVSFLGSFVLDSKIAHLTHLGGLMFGLLYYELHVKKYRRFSSRVTSWKT